MLFFPRMSEGHRTFRLRNTALLIGGLALASACGDDGNVGGAGGSGATTSSVGTSGVQAGPTSSSVTSTATSSQSVSDAGSSVDASTSSGMGGQGGSGTGGGPNLPDYAPEMEPNDDFSSPNALPANKLGFYGELDSGQDSDVYSIVAYQGDSLRVKISDGMGGCPPGNVAFQLQVFDSDENNLGSVFGECPLLDGSVDPDIGSLPDDDTYLVRVTALDVVPFYVVEISVPPPVCGDGVKHATEECDDSNTTPGDGCDATCNREPVCGDGFVDTPPEECDDGGTTPGDGCDATCQFEGNFCGEAEPNNNLGETNYIQGCDAVLGQISVIGDQDFFKFDVVTPGTSVRLEVTAFQATQCPVDSDMYIRLYGPNGAQIATDDDSGIDACPLINPVNVSAARNLPVGTYRVSVEDLSNDETTPPYVLRMDLNEPGCGDGFLQAGEACDDGNTTAGDGCSPTCQFEGCAEVEPNDTTATATSTTTCNDVNGSISPVGDGDYYSVTITTPGSSIRVETTQIGGPLCGSSNDNFVRLFNGAGTELGSDNDDGDGSCALINPVNDPFAANLAPGTYFVKVEENGNNATLTGYSVHIDVLLPECGDGITQVGEECDDGNLSDADFCDSMCQLPSGICSESEPNNSIATADSAAGCNVFLGAIAPAMDGDYYAVDVTTAGSAIRVETTSATSLFCPSSGADAVVRLYNSAGTELGSDNDDGYYSCSLINPGIDGFAANLPVGTYYVKVEENGNDGQLVSYAVHIDVILPECGNGIVEAGEECDDANTLDTDFCDTMCGYAPDVCNETEPNGTSATANNANACALTIGSIGPVGDQDYFSFDVTVANSSVRLEVVTPTGFGCGSDTTMRLFSPTNTELGSDTDDGNWACPFISSADSFARGLPVGRYTVRIEEPGNDAQVGIYGLRVDVIPPGCGDGQIQAPEVCDDYNTRGDDACNATCSALNPLTPEAEPNGSIATATPLGAGAAGFSGQITPIGDDDYYSFVVPDGATVRLETGSVPFVATSTSCPGDLEIYFYDAAGTLLASDDDESFIGLCSLLDRGTIAMNNLAAGTYYVRVERHGDSGTVGTYSLIVTVDP